MNNILGAQHKALRRKTEGGVLFVDGTGVHLIAVHVGNMGQRRMRRDGQLMGIGTLKGERARHTAD